MNKPDGSKYKIAVAGTGYVGMSLAGLLAQHNTVTAVDIVPERVEMVNRRKSPIRDDYIEKYLSERELDLKATLDAAGAYADADYIIIAAPTNYDPKQDFFDCSAVENVLETVLPACKERRKEPAVVNKEHRSRRLYRERVQEVWNGPHYLFTGVFKGIQGAL